MADHQDYTAVKPIVQETKVELSVRPVGVTGGTRTSLRWAESFDAATLRRELATKHASDDDTVDPLSRSCFAEITTEKLGDCTEDVCEELTSLSWLQNSNLLRDFKTKVPLDPCDDLFNGLDSTSGRERDRYSVAITAHSSGHAITSSLSSCNSTTGRRSASGKPPYSFACLIFMAIEESPTKSLPVKDIYKWIEDNFDYFRSAPTGWKNSVRHNLSLNKSFKRIDKQKGQAPGKGSLWTVDPTNRISLLQALKKTHHQSLETYINEHAVLNTRRLSRGSNSSAASDGDLESQAKRLCMEIAPDEAQAVEIMCSIGNPHILQEGLVIITDTKSSSNCSTPPLVAPKATFAPTPATPVTENRIQGSRQLTQHKVTAFQPTEGPRRRNLFSTLATVATLTKDIEERLSRNNSARSSPVQTRRARAAKAAEEEMDTAILLHAAVAKRLAHGNGKKSPVDRDFDFEIEPDGTDRQHAVDDDEEDELSVSRTNGLNDSGYGGQTTDSSVELQQPAAEQGMADILLEADKLLTMRDKQTQTQLIGDGKRLGKSDVDQNGTSVRLAPSVVMQPT